MKKTLTLVVALLLALTCATNAFACTAIYVGGNLTSDGSTFFARSEDMSNSMNKLYFAYPAGKHKAGEVYTGCYGFTYTFTKDSYACTGFTDDNILGICPDCGESHDHTPYQAAGTNEMGVSMTATESLYSSDAIDEVDPYLDAGIEEAEIVTVILSEAATAKEGVELLLKIYEESGCCGGSGIFIADKNEIWYIENCSGTQYIALKLNADLAFVEPNVSVIGLIDLDDTENVIASSALIEVAQKAGTFIGNADENQIDFSGSYTGYALSTSERMVNALNYVNGVDTYTAENITPADFTISNVKDDAIVPVYTAIKLASAYTVQDIFNYYKLDAIGKTGNLETHIFIPGDVTVEWVAMNDAQYNVFVPYISEYTTDTYAGYQVGTEEASFVTEEPDSGFYYPTTQRVRSAEGVSMVEGFKILPEGWETSYYWTFDALSNYLEYIDGSQKEYVAEQLDALQQEFVAQLSGMLAGVNDGTATKESLTAASMAMAQQAQEKAYALYLEISAK